MQTAQVAELREQDESGSGAAEGMHGHGAAAVARADVRDWIDAAQEEPWVIERYEAPAA